MKAIFFAWIVFFAAVKPAHALLSPYPEDVTEWKNPQTQLTDQLGEGCGMLYQAKLLRSGAVNYVALFLDDTSGGEVKVNAQDAEFSFSSGKKRIPYQPTPEVQLRTGQKTWVLLPFPEKSDLKDEEQVDLVLPIRSGEGFSTICPVTIQFKRDLSKKQSSATVSDHIDNVLDVSLGAGLVRTGAQASTSGDSFTVGVGVTHYYEHHGIFADLLVETQRNVNTAVVAPPSGVTPGTELVVDNGVLAVGYSYRLFPADHWVMNFDIGPGLYFINYGPKSSSNMSGTVTFGVDQRLGLYYLIPRGFSAFQFGAGISIYNLVSAGGSVGGAPFAGDSFGVVFNLKMGL